MSREGWWPTERRLFRRNRRIEPQDAALLCVVIVGSVVLYFFGA